MGDVEHFALLVLVVGVAITGAVLSNRISERIRIPAPAIFLLAAAVASDVVPALGRLSVTTVQRVVSVALVVILFDGGMHIGWRRFRTAAGSIWVGVAGTFVTAAALAAVAHALFDLDWWAALLLARRWRPPTRRWCSRCWGAARSPAAAGPSWKASRVPTSRSASPCWPACWPPARPPAWMPPAASPARSCSSWPSGPRLGRPVGCCWSGSCAGCRCPARGCTRCGSWPAPWSSMRRRPSPTARASWPRSWPASWPETPAPLQGGDRTVPRCPGQPGRDRGLCRARPYHRPPYPARQRRAGDRPGPGRAADRGGPPAGGRAAAGAGPADLGERLFVLWAGLKGAVPILLGTFLLTAGVPDASRLYAIIVVVVVFSVIVQGGLVPAVAARLGVPMRAVEPEPWSLGVRFRQEPRGLRRHVVAAGSPADGCRIGDLEVGEDVWISFVIRDGQLVPVRGSTVLRAGDEILALTDPERGPDLAPIFTPMPGSGHPGPTPT